MTPTDTLREAVASRPTRKTITDLFVRVCRDSGYRLGPIRAMRLTAQILGIHPLEVGYAMPSIGAAVEIASGRAAPRLDATVRGEEG